MRTTRHILKAVLILIMPQLMAIGCSLVGLGVGALFDNSNGPVRVSVIVDSLYTTTPGEELGVTWSDSIHTRGEFEGLIELKAKEYRSRYDSAVAQIPGSIALPRPGDEIVCAMKKDTGKVFHARFTGVDPGTIVIEGIRRVSLADLHFLKKVDGSSIDVSALQEASVGNLLPSITDAVRISTEERVVVIPISSINRIEKFESRNGKFVGFLIGAAIDMGSLIVCRTQDH